MRVGIGIGIGKVRAASESKLDKLFDDYIDAIAADGAIYDAEALECFRIEFRKLYFSGLVHTAAEIFRPFAWKVGEIFQIKGGVIDFDRNSVAYRSVSGVLVQMAADVVRMQGACPVMLNERAATNLLLRSEEFSNASWTKVAGAITANTDVAPDGATTADRFTADGTNSSHRFFQAASGVSGTTYTASIYVKAGTANFVQIAFSGATPFGLTNFANFNLTNGTVGTTGGLQVNSRITLEQGYYRITSTITAIGTGAGQLDFCIVPSASATRLQAFISSGTMVLWGAQLETGNTATSYTKSEGAVATRLADLPSQSFSFGATAGAVVFEVKASAQTPNSIFEFKNSGGTTQFRISVSGGSVFFEDSTNGNQIIGDIGVNVQNKAVFGLAWDGTNVAVYLPSGQVADMIPVAWGQITQYTATGNLNGEVTKIDKFTFALSFAKFKRYYL